jgi:hypothetical protein
MRAPFKGPVKPKRVTSTSGNSGMGGAPKAKLRLSSVHEKISLLDLVHLVGWINGGMGSNRQRPKPCPSPTTIGPDGRGFL